MALKIGCDLCQVASLEQMLQEDPGSLERLFNDQERRYAMAQGRPAQHLAGIFAAKEALAKAIRKPELLGKYHQEVTVGHREDGTPVFFLSEKLRETFLSQGIRPCDLSISHDGDYAVAAVLVELSQTDRLHCHRCLIPLKSLSEQGIADFLVLGSDPTGAPRYLCPVCVRGW